MILTGGGEACAKCYRNRVETSVTIEEKIEREVDSLLPQLNLLVYAHQSCGIKASQIY